MIAIGATATEPEEREPIFPRPEYDEFVAQALEASREWYGNSLPRRVDGYDFLDFAARSWDFVRKITTKGVIKVNKSLASACTDGTTIWLPGCYFEEKFYLSRADMADAVGAAVMCVNGSQIHEGLHCLLSQCNLPEWAATNPVSAELSKKHIGFNMVLNLIEDLFIEQWCYKKHDYLTMFLHGKNNILLGQVPMWESMNNLYQPDATQDALIASLACLKNINHRKDERWAPWQEIVDCALLAANEKLSQSERLQIAIDVWNLIMNAENSAGMPMPCGNAVATAPDSSSVTMGGALSPEELEKLIDKLLELAEAGELGEALAGPEGDGGDGAGEPGEPKPGSGSGGMVVVIDASKFGSTGLAKLDKLMKIKTGTIDYTGDSDQVVENTFNMLIENMKIKRGEGKVNISKIPQVVVKDILELTSAAPDLQPSKEFKNLGQILRYMRQEKHQPGAPRTSGSKLMKGRIARILTDGKVMALHDSDHITKGKPEIIMLLDLSGSMESGGLVQRVAKAALGAYQSLVACQVPVSVYGHTALVRGGSYVPLVYAIAGYQMPLVRKSPTITKAPARGFSLATVVEHSQNFDGIAIDCVSKRFSEKPGTKILVVLSDGQPYGGSDYGGQRALEHTAEVIRRLNHSKISVLSLSLTDEVMEANDKLYGKGNLPAYGSLLDKSLRHLVQVIATGQPLT